MTTSVGELFSCRDSCAFTFGAGLWWSIQNFASNKIYLNVEWVWDYSGGHQGYGKLFIPSLAHLWRIITWLYYDHRQKCVFVYDHDTTLRLNFSYNVHVHGGSSVAFFAIIYHIHLCVLWYIQVQQYYWLLMLIASTLDFALWSLCHFECFYFR